MSNIDILPRDIICLIIRKLDIDSRRKLGIYTKLKVPQNIKEKLNNIFNNSVLFHCSRYSRLSFGPIRNTYDGYQKYMYSLNVSLGYSKRKNKKDGMVYNLGKTYYEPSIFNKDTLDPIIYHIEHITKDGNNERKIIWCVV